MGADTGVNPFEQQHKKEVAERKEANRQFAAPGRIGPLPPIIDVGEQVIGSRHVFELGVPAVVDDFRGTATVLGSVVPSDPGGRPSPFEEGLKLEPGTVDNVVAKSAFSLAGRSGAPVPFDPQQPEPLRVEFHPQMAGPISAMLNLKFYWSDGGYTERIVILRGQSHALGDAPQDSQVDHRHEPVVDVGAKVLRSTDTGEDFRTALRRARDDLAVFKEKQSLGIDLAEQEASSFQEAPPEAPWWTILADIAISMGVAAIAGITGISQEIADRIWKYPLAHVPMPITLEVHTSDRTHRYTRDEAGRVRVDRPIGASTDGEPQQIRDASQLFEHVLARSLQGWGLPQIETDDATKRGNR